MDYGWHQGAIETIPMNATTDSQVIPRPAKIESFNPARRLRVLAQREGNSKKPVYEMHKWWARRLSSNFRMLLLGATTPRGVPGQTLWKKFYQSQDLEGMVVLDPFMGGGTTIVEATKIGAKVIGSDIDPVAWFVTKKEVEPFNHDAFTAALGKLEAILSVELSPFYMTTLDDGRTATVTNFFWVLTLKCEACEELVELHPHYVLWHEKKRAALKESGRRSPPHRKTVFCRACHEVKEVSAHTKTLKCSCGAETKIDAGTTRSGRYKCLCGHEGSLLKHVSPGKPLKPHLFALEWEIPAASRKEHERGFSCASDADRAIYAKAAAQVEALWDSLPIPKHAIPTEDRKDNRPVNYGYSHYHQLFNARQLLTLGRILQEIAKLEDVETREYLLLAFSDSLASNNMLCPYAFGYRKLTPLFGLHAYRMITRPVEGNAWGAYFGRGSFKKCAEKVVRGKLYCEKPSEYWGPTRSVKVTGETISARTTHNPDEWRNGNARALLLNQSSTHLEGVQDGEVDLILTDPPYYNNLPYSEMSDFFFAWIKSHLPDGAKWKKQFTPYKESLFVQRNTLEEYRDYVNGMSGVFKECRRVLSDDGLMVFTYHHLDPRAWLALSTAMIESGFVVTHCFPLLAEGKSGFHSSEGNIKWDAVFCCRPGTPKIPRRREEVKWTKNWIADAQARVRALGKVELPLGQADKRSFAMALAAAAATDEPLVEGDMFLLLRETSQAYATSRLKSAGLARIRPHKMRTAQWFIPNHPTEPSSLKSASARPLESKDTELPPKKGRRNKGH